MEIAELEHTLWRKNFLENAPGFITWAGEENLKISTKVKIRNTYRGK